MGNQLPDSGGSYADQTATGSVSGLVSRTYRDAKTTITRGETGGYAAKLTVGAGVASVVFMMYDAAFGGN